MHIQQSSNSIHNNLTHIREINKQQTDPLPIITIDDNISNSPITANQTEKEKIKEIKRITEQWSDINMYTDGSMDPTDDNNMKM
ncbi:17804_t:CDS:1, partial [Acaulospora morrowiae]